MSQSLRNLISGPNRSSGADLREVMASKSDEDLRAIIGARTGEYTEDATKAAVLEGRRRGLSIDSPATPSESGSCEGYAVPVGLELRVKRAILCSQMDGGDTRFELRLFCSPAHGFGTLEIGDRHVFADRPNRSILGKRKSCELQVSVMRRGSLTQENIESIGLSASKIGNLCFVPPGEKDLFVPAQPAALDARVFVSDELFERLVNSFQAGKKANWLELDIEKPGVLEYGWEPDGSRKTWKLENEKDLSYVDVSSIDISTGLFEEQPKLHFFAQIADVIPGPLVWLAIGFLAFIACKWIVLLLIRK